MIFLGIAGDHLTDHALIRFARIACNERCWAPESDRGDDGVSRLCKGLDLFVFRFVPAEHRLQPLADSEVPSHLQEMDIRDVIAGHMGEQIPQPGCDDRIGKEAPAGRTGIILYAKPVSQIDLGLPRPPGY